MTIDELYQHFNECSGVCTDTRKIKTGCLFFALKGPNFNANEFAQKAIELGAKFAVIDDDTYSGEQTLLVQDVLECLQDLARYHRSQFTFPIIGLTGSNGKTTTKELIYNVLATSKKVSCTQGNLNNHIGVPLTILSFDLDLDFGIVEMGANHQKEIEFLCTISQPDFGLITNFGKAHLEGFGGVEGVIKGKSELYDYLKLNGKYAFINTDDKKQLEQIGDYVNVISFGSTITNKFRIQLDSADPYVTISYNETVINSQLIGDYNFGNISVAVAIGGYFELSPKTIKSGIEAYVPDNNRSEIINRGRNQIIMDAYNANPTSMLAALVNFNKLEATNKYLFLGDMFELGEDAQKEHQEIVDYAEEHFNTNVYLLGIHFYNTVTESATQKFESLSSAIDTLKSIKLKNANVLIKGSRGMALERILDYLDFE